jgi:ATP-dependent RNA helicase DDX5/DBP2
MTCQNRKDTVLCHSFPRSASSFVHFHSFFKQNDLYFDTTTNTYSNTRSFIMSHYGSTGGGSYGGGGYGGGGGSYGGGYGGGGGSYGGGGNSYGGGYAGSSGGGGGYGLGPPSGGGNLGSNLGKIDFANTELPVFEKDFYIEHPDVSKRSEDEANAWRASKQIVVQGRDVPKPVMTFDEASMPEYVLNEVLKQGFDKPTPIQSQGWPMALKGRNMVGVSATGSGKTLAFLLPGMIHINAQVSICFGVSR